MENIRVVSFRAVALICITSSSVVVGLGAVCPQSAQASSSATTLVEQAELLSLSPKSLEIAKGYTPPNNGKPKNGRGAGTRT